MKSILFALIGILVLVGFPTFFSTTPVSSHELVSERLSLKEALGQTLLVGFEGKEMNPELETLVKRMQPGGVLLLKRNIEEKEQAKKLIADLQEISRVPLFVAVDQEGGIVSRVWWGESTPQAELNNQVEAMLVGRRRAEGLRELGINMNLAPVLDSASSGDYLFPRSFQNDPMLSSLFAHTLTQAHEQEGVLSVLKHYPGYDDISFNPETEIIPRVREFPQAEAFSNLFFRLVPPLLMLSHVVYEDVDSNNPLPLSEQGIAKVRERAGEDVLLMSDDLLSVAFVEKYSPEELGSRALLSGVDILLAAGYPDEEVLGAFYKGLWLRAKRNPDLAERIRTSAAEILELKLALFQDQ